MTRQQHRCMTFFVLFPLQHVNNKIFLLLHTFRIHHAATRTTYFTHFHTYSQLQPSTTTTNNTTLSPRQHFIKTTPSFFTTTTITRLNQTITSLTPLSLFSPDSFFYSSFPLQRPLLLTKPPSHPISANYSPPIQPTNTPSYQHHLTNYPASFLFNHSRHVPTSFPNLTPPPSPAFIISCTSLLPPPNLYKTLLYTIFDAFHPILKILFSIQTLLIFFTHLILTITLFVYFSPPFPDLNTYTHSPTNYWLLFFLLYLPFSLFLAILSYFLRLLKFILYSASSFFKRAIHISFSYISSQYTTNFYLFKISYLYPIANFFYTLAIGPNNSYLPPRIKQYIIYKMAPRTRSLTRSSPDDPNNPTDDILYQNPNPINRPPRTIRRTITVGCSCIRNVCYLMSRRISLRKP